MADFRHWGLPCQLWTVKFVKVKEKYVSFLLKPLLFGKEGLQKPGRLFGSLLGIQSDILIFPLCLLFMCGLLRLQVKGRPLRPKNQMAQDPLSSFETDETETVCGRRPHTTDQCHVLIKPLTSLMGREIGNIRASNREVFEGK